MSATFGTVEFAKLVSAGQVGTVTRGIERAIELSFVTHPMRTFTQAEIKRRFDLCADMLKVLRGELKWGIDRAIDQLPTFLTKSLNGEDWKPNDRKMWVPSDGAL